MPVARTTLTETPGRGCESSPTTVRFSARRSGPGDGFVAGLSGSSPVLDDANPTGPASVIMARRLTTRVQIIVYPPLRFAQETRHDGNRSDASRLLALAL